jgi:cation diffusion facilitator CzcD-associated flavoprotein CzcO
LPTSLPALIVGAGPAGLATAAELSQRGIDYRLLERGSALGWTWENLYDSLTLHTGKHLSTLPGRSYARNIPLFPSKHDFLRYLRDYARSFDLRIETGAEVMRSARTSGGWLTTTTAGQTIASRTLVVATGIVANPRMPELPGRREFRGRVLHSVDYHRPDEFVGQRVLVVGVGNSGGEIGTELARSGAQVTVAVRSGANVVPREIAGVPLQYLAYGMRNLPTGMRRGIAGFVQWAGEKRRGAPVLPRPSHGALDSIPLIGFNLVDAIKEGLVAVHLSAPVAFTPAGVRFADGAEAPFDIVLFATGFSPALSALGALVRTDAKGFAMRSDRVVSADQPALYFVGHNYDSTGGLSNIRVDAPLVANAIQALR